MKSRTIPAAALIAGIVAGASCALADVKVNTPGAKIDTPAGPVNVQVDVDPKLKPSQAWIGRAVYSIDGKKLGEVAAVDGERAYVDMGGFLGIGEHRVLLNAPDIGSVTEERIVLKLTEADAKALPEIEKPATVK